MAKHKRQEILDAAREYIDRYPKWTNTEINTMLRLEYGGSYLTNRTYARLRKESAEVVPFFHPTIAGNEPDILRAEGFTTSEIKSFLKGWKKTIDSPAFVAMRHSRIKWWAGMIHQGYTRRQIWGAIHRWYSTTHRSPWEWLRREYKPARHISQSQYRDALAKRRKASKVTKPMYHLLRTKPKVRV